MVKWGVLLIAGLIAVAAFTAMGGQQRTTLAAETETGTEGQANNAAPEVDLWQMETDFATREAVYRQQVLELEKGLQERQATYAQQVGELQEALTRGRARLQELNAQESNAKQQITQLSDAGVEQQALLQVRRQEAETLYQVRYNDMLAQLSEVQAKLAEAHQILGH